ncbi:MAG: hypothetical protein AABM40_04475 [Chloroflexota bacterium]
MPADLRIADGNPIWLSQSIVPSKDTVISPGQSPSAATPNVNSTDVFTYIKVENTGNVDLGACACAAAVPAPWPTVVLFANFLANPNASTSQTQSGVTFTVSNFGDSLSGTGINFSFGLSASGKRAWAWSPDSRFFAYVGSPNGNDWYLTVVALQNVTRSNGTVINKGQAAVTGNGLFAGPPYWTNANFGWAGSKAVAAAGAYAGGGGIVRMVACPEAPSPNTYGDLIPDMPGQVDWTQLSSPCGSVFAFVPRVLQAAVGSRDIMLISTATAQVVSFRKNNVPTSVGISGANPSITTNQHAANGVHVITGGSPVDVDDPDCTTVGGGIAVIVDRVKASTLPSANLGVLGVGSATLGVLLIGQNRWVQVPNSNASGWSNQGEQHWCLLGQAYTSDGSTIPRPWNGQAASPPPFPVNNNNCAQRNIQILP